MNSAAAASTSTALTSLEVAQWRADLNYFASTMEAYHHNAFHDISKEDFMREVSALRAKIPSLNREQVIIGLKHLAALIHDAHTGMDLTTSPPVGFHPLPLKVYWYSDGLFVQAAPPKYKNIVGAKIIRIGSVPTDEALKRIATLAEASSEWTYRSEVQFFFRGEVLHALGLSDRSEGARFEFATSEGPVTLDMDVLSGPLMLGYSPGAPAKSDWIDARSGSPPLYLERKDKYWFKFLEDKHILYIQCNEITNADNESFEQFFARAFMFADTNPVDKVVLDLRLNGGGNNELTPVLVQNVIKHERWNATGKLFVLIGRNTQSAAENLVNRLQRDTHAIFVGEPTGERPNMYGDAYPFLLPNSHIQVDISSLFWQDMDPRDERQWTGPDLAAELTSDNYAHNVDPAFEVITSQTYVLIRQALQPFTDEGDIPGLKAAYKRYLQEPIHRFAQTQDQIDALANELLQKDKKDIALELFKLNADTYPKSQKAMDNMGDAYVAMEDTVHALDAYASALKLNPKDGLAASRLRALKAGGEQMHH
jgi:peptidase S41-like protein